MNGSMSVKLDEPCASPAKLAGARNKFMDSFAGQGRTLHSFVANKLISLISWRST